MGDANWYITQIYERLEVINFGGVVLTNCSLMLDLFVERCSGIQLNAAIAVQQKGCVYRIIYIYIGFI